MSVLSVGESRRQTAAAASASSRAGAHRHDASTAPRRRAPGVPAPLEAPARPPLRLVEPQGRARRLSVGLLSTLCLVAVFLGLFALAAMHSLVVQAQFELDRVDQSVADRRSQIEERRVQVAQAESPAAVVAAAEALGMVPADDRVHLVPEAQTPAEQQVDDVVPTLPEDGSAAPADAPTATP